MKKIVPNRIYNLIHKLNKTLPVIKNNLLILRIKILLTLKEKEINGIEIKKASKMNGKKMKNFLLGANQ